MILKYTYMYIFAIYIFLNINYICYLPYSLKKPLTSIKKLDASSGPARHKWCNIYNYQCNAWIAHVRLLPWKTQLEIFCSLNLIKISLQLQFYLSILIYQPSVTSHSACKSKVTEVLYEFIMRLHFSCKIAVSAM